MLEHSPRACRTPIAAAVLCALLSACSSGSNDAAPDPTLGNDDVAASTDGIPTAGTSNALEVTAEDIKVPLIIGYTTLAPEGAADGTEMATLQLVATIDTAQAGTPGASVVVEPVAGGEAVEPPAGASPGASAGGTPAQLPGDAPDPVPAPAPPPSVAVAPDAVPAGEPDIGAATGAPANVAVRTPTVGAARGDVIRIMSDVRVSRSQLMVQQTPVATGHGYVYTANIELGPDGDTRGDTLRTVVRQGTQDADGSWNWKSATVDDDTVNDAWHTAPSVATDQDGLVHVVYNHHNIPWQYQRSTEPHSLDGFEFRGETVTDAEIDRWWKENRTNFPTLGTADIPGTMITYPAFYKNNAGGLFATYRFAARPKRGFTERTMSGGVARYDVSTKAWKALGGQVDVTDADRDRVDGAPDAPVALASEMGWTVYHPRLMFDANDQMTVQHFWRNGIAGAELTRPCVQRMVSDDAFMNLDGSNASLPVRSGDCGNTGWPDSQEFYSIGSVAMDSAGTPNLILSPIGQARKLMTWDAGAGSWRREDSPSAATEIFFDADDTLWAIGRDLRVHKRERGSSTWDKVHEEGGGWCFPKASLNEDKSIAYVHSHSCDEKRVAVFAIRLR